MTFSSFHMAVHREIGICGCSLANIALTAVHCYLFTSQLACIKSVIYSDMYVAVWWAPREPF